MTDRPSCHTNSYSAKADSVRFKVDETTSSNATFTIHKYDLYGYEGRSFSKLTPKKMTATIEVPRLLLEARSPGSRANILLMQIQGPKSRDEQLRGRSPGAAASIQRAKDSRRASKKETQSPCRSHAKQESGANSGMKQAQQSEPRKPESTVTATASNATIEKVAAPKIEESNQPKPKPRPVKSLTVDPMEAEFKVKGGMSSHILLNESNVRLAIKIKTSNNEFFRVNPVYSFLDSGAMNELEVFRLPGGMPRVDKLLLCYVVAKDDDTDAKALFTLRAKIQNIAVKLTTTA